MANLNTIRSITQVGTYEPFELQVARGQITGHRGIRINAYNLAVGTSQVTVWPKNTVYAFPASASTMTLYSSVTGDVGQTVLIQGLDANYAEIQEVVALNGQTGTATTNSYLRINKMQVVIGAPTGNISLGTGAATSGVPANTYGYILAGDGATLSSVWTVPAGYTLYVTGNTLVIGGLATSQTDIVGYRARTVNGVSLLLNKVTQGNASVVMDVDPPVGIPEKTDISANSQASSGTCTTSVMLSAILIKNFAEGSNG